MEIIKTFTWPLSIKKALLLISEVPDAVRPLMKITYKLGYDAPTEIKGVLWCVDIMLPNCYREDDYFVILISDYVLGDTHIECTIQIKDVIQLDVYDRSTIIFYKQKLIKIDR